MSGSSPTNALIKDKARRFTKAAFYNLSFSGDTIETSSTPDNFKKPIVFLIFKKEIVSLPGKVSLTVRLAPCFQVNSSFRIKTLPSISLAAPPRGAGAAGRIGRS
jgi:hypothetical protein